MTTFRAEEFTQRKSTLEGYEVRITGYRLLERYLCKIDNVSPGATIARGEGKTAAEAEEQAVARATQALASTRRLQSARKALTDAHANIEGIRAALKDIDR